MLWVGYGSETRCLRRIDGNWAAMPPASNPPFPRQCFDGETGLNQNWNRDYGPTIGRYVQSDPVGLMGGIDTFTYANGNPITNTDRDGLQVLPLPSLIPWPAGGPTAQSGRLRSDDSSALEGPRYTPVPGLKTPALLSKSAAQQCEEDCEKTYDKEIEECRTYSAMTGDK